MHNNKALLYCSVWPEDPGTRSLDSQLVELQTYCMNHGLETVPEVEQDDEPSPPGSLRPGLLQALRRTDAEGIGHLVLWEPGQLGRGSWEALIWLRQMVRRGSGTVHVASWNLSSADDEFQRTLSRCEGFLRLDQRWQRHSDAQGFRETLRRRPVWKRMFMLLRDERYAEALIQALFEVKDAIRLSDQENQAVHGGYDHLQMFRAVGFRIKGEDTDNTRLVADVLSRHWDAVRPKLAADVCRRVESPEGPPATGALL